jgi:phosphatidate cytidylyltransferase
MADNVVAVFAGIFVLLAAVTVALLVAARRMPGRDLAELRQRTKTWWVIVVLFALALVLGTTAGIVLFAFVSFLSLKEFLSLIPTRRVDRRVLLWAYLAIPVQYLWVAYAWYGMFIIFIPVYMFLAIPMLMALQGQTANYLRAAGTLHWGLMITVFALSHAAMLLMVDDAQNPVAGGAGLLLYLVVLTQANDVAQFVWGKLFGRHAIVPSVSPKKTWEGLIGGVATTTVFAALLAPLLTPVGMLQALPMGAMIGVAGFFGDITISAVKRDLGVKDSGTMLPGHGGILDRVDSLTFTAPLFFHLALYFWLQSP